MLLRSFVTLVFALVVFGSPVGRSVAQIESDIQVMAKQAQEVDDLVKELPISGGTNNEIFAISEDTAKLLSTIETGTNHAAATSMLSDQDAITLLQSLDGSVSSLETVLQDIEAKKPAFTANNVNGMVKTLLVNLDTKVSAFGKAIIAIIPEDLKSHAQALITKAQIMLTSAISDF